MKSKNKKLREVFASPQWNRHNKNYGFIYHAGRKHAKDLEDERKAKQGLPLN
jgi:hypothetical protein